MCRRVSRAQTKKNVQNYVTPFVQRIGTRAHTHTHTHTQRSK